MSHVHFTPGARAATGIRPRNGAAYMANLCALIAASNKQISFVHGMHYDGAAHHKALPPHWGESPAALAAGGTPIGVSTGHAAIAAAYADPQRWTIMIHQLKTDALAAIEAYLGTVTTAPGGVASVRLGAGRIDLAPLTQAGYPLWERWVERQRDAVLMSDRAQAAQTLPLSEWRMNVPRYILTDRATLQVGFGYQFAPEPGHEQATIGAWLAARNNPTEWAAHMHDGAIPGVLAEVVSACWRRYCLKVDWAGMTVVSATAARRLRNHEDIELAWNQGAVNLLTQLVFTMQGALASDIIVTRLLTDLVPDWESKSVLTSTHVQSLKWLLGIPLMAPAADYVEAMTAKSTIGSSLTLSAVTWQDVPAPVIADFLATPGAMEHDARLQVILNHVVTRSRAWQVAFQTQNFGTMYAGIVALAAGRLPDRRVSGVVETATTGFVAMDAGRFVHSKSGGAIPPSILELMRATSFPLAADPIFETQFGGGIQPTLSLGQITVPVKLDVSTDHEALAAHLGRGALSTIIPRGSMYSQHRSALEAIGLKTSTTHRALLEGLGGDLNARLTTANTPGLLPAGLPAPFNGGTGGPNEHALQFCGVHDANGQFQTVPYDTDFPTYAYANNGGLQVTEFTPDSYTMGRAGLHGPTGRYPASVDFHDPANFGTMGQGACTELRISLCSAVHAGRNVHVGAFQPLVQATDQVIAARNTAGTSGGASFFLGDQVARDTEHLKYAPCVLVVESGYTDSGALTDHALIPGGDPLPDDGVYWENGDAARLTRQLVTSARNIAPTNTNTGLDGATLTVDAAIARALERI